MKNVLFYAINGLGLGHLTRLLSIARKLKALDNSINPFFLTSSEACHVLFKHNIPYVKLPSKTISRECGMKENELALLYQTTVLNLFSILKPTALVVDTFPVGSLDDLFGCLTLKSSCKKIFVHREQRQSKMTPARTNLQGFYDLIIAPHNKGTAHIPVPKKDKLFWSGPIMVRTKDELMSPEKVKEMFNFPKNKKLIYLTFGGGGDPTDNECYKQTINLLSPYKDKMHIVATKPPLCRSYIMPSDFVSVIEWYPMIELMHVFDAAISGAGYNTFHELMYCGVPSIFIPKHRGHDDQEGRAMQAQNAKAGYCIKETALKEKLLPQLNNLLEDKNHFSRNAQKFVNTNGANLAAKEIFKLI